MSQSNVSGWLPGLLGVLGISGTGGSGKMTIRYFGPQAVIT
jgi:hypothetical protein